MMKHPLDKFVFCPVCGSHSFAVNNFKSKRCSSCGFVYYANPYSATAAFIRNERDELLISVRANDPAKGTLDLPGGFVDMGETAEQGILRELNEETAFDFESEGIPPCYLFSIPNIYLYSGMEIHTLDMFFEFIADSSFTFRASDDAAELRWIPIRKIEPSHFGLNSIRLAVKKYLEL